MLSHFAAMHPYLKLIARANGLNDEFDERAVEAYWLGNKLLNKVSLNSFFQYVKKRLPAKELKWFEQKLPQGAKPNHQFHVFNFITRTGHRQIPHTVETMDQCRISWGKILPGNQVTTQRLINHDKKLKLVPAIKPIKNFIKDFKIGDLVTLHWGWICEKITREQAKNLEHYTNLALKLANKTI